MQKKAVAPKKLGSKTQKSLSSVASDESESVVAQAVGETFGRSWHESTKQRHELKLATEMIHKMAEAIAEIKPHIRTEKDEEARILLKGFEEGEERSYAASPDDATFSHLLEHVFGHGFHGWQAGNLIFQAQAKAGLRPLIRGEAPLGRFDDGYLGGFMVSKLCEALASEDGGFFRVLSHMIDCDFSAPPKIRDLVAYALNAMGRLERAGIPLTKKAVRLAAEKDFATHELKQGGQIPTPELIRRATDRLTWDWKRIWKKHPDFDRLLQDPGGAPRKRRKPGTK